MAALDADKDGKLSAEEIQGAAEALKTLDKNNDNALTRDELRPSVSHDRSKHRHPRHGRRGPHRDGERKQDKGPDAADGAKQDAQKKDGAKQDAPKKDGAKKKGQKDGDDAAPEAPSA